jgi:hypothetical protein
MTKLYVGCGLTHAPMEFKNSVAQLKIRLRAMPGLEVLDFLGTQGTPRDVYVNDIEKCVKVCDALLAICDYPSTGLGFEMATQVSRQKPILAVAHHQALVSRLILDPPLAFYNFESYWNLVEDVPRLVVRHLGPFFD